MSRVRRRSSMNVYDNTKKFEHSTNFDNVVKREEAKQLKKVEDAKKIELPQEAINTLPYFDDERQMDKLIELYRQKTEFDEGVKKELFASLQDDKYSRLTKEHLPTSDDVIDYLHKWGTSDRNMKLLPDPSVKERGERITIESYKKKVGPHESKFTLSKTSTGFSDAEINRRHRMAKMKKIDILKYGAEHFYNTNNMENIIHEKDGVISKMKQFDYKTYRPIDRSKLKNKTPASTLEIQKR